MAANLTFDQFYRDVFPQGIRFLIKVYGLNFHDAEEIVQSALVDFWYEHPNVSDLAKPYGFFKAFLRMRALQVVSIRMALPVTLSDAHPSVVKDQRKPSLDLPVDDHEHTYGDFRPSGGASVEATVLARLEWEEISAVIRHLPLPQQIMISRRAHGYSFPEIAARLHQQYGRFSAQTVAQTLVEVRRTLRQQMQVAKGTARIKRAKLHQPWSTIHAACQRCGTTTIAHAAHGYCHDCYPQMRRQLRRAGIEQRIKHYEWSHAYPACVACGTTSHPHNGHGYCRPCYWRLFGSAQRAAALG
ncbi:MAG: sigma-70 family RNA polymerase sigma factor [Ktedonobacteraceae bacterium]|nr:sigma-70 family RNA polymerase sigma factor [Ktedonobacteraceae bacterium]MBA3823677.1 sigma-70 family RNA polymerase sigma factor [Ktedonobacterales bacterium]